MTSSLLNVRSVATAQAFPMRAPQWCSPTSTMMPLRRT
jgi:hypothetical protein